MNAITIAIKGKGILNFLRRSLKIIRHYGLTSHKMNQALMQFTNILHRFGCKATFPITSTALRRNPQVIQNYKEENFEFAIHGHRHIDHCQLSFEDQSTQLASAQRIFEEIGIQAQGFRGPYLHANADTLAALREQNLIYDSSQGLAWDVLDGHETPVYLGALKFYGALSAKDYPSLPTLEENLVRIPYSLPDDEALLERLNFETTEQMSDLWLSMLYQTLELGELFVLGLHPERISFCEAALEAVLTEAIRLAPKIWIARLDEIAIWWRDRATATVDIKSIDDNKFRILVTGPANTTVLARHVRSETQTKPWANGYHQVMAKSFTAKAPLRPLIGLSPEASPELASFLRQQGYILEISEARNHFSYYFSQTNFQAMDQRQLLNHIEGTNRPLIRLGRWPNSARSALSITGDIDALTLWDYGLRFLGR